MDNQDVPCFQGERFNFQGPSLLIVKAPEGDKLIGRRDEYP